MITLGNVDLIRQYRYLKNGAMYSILFLGVVMMCGRFGLKVPQWISPILTLTVVGFLLARSIREMQESL
jgi:hypothetical protein